jgi:hypothetical protein
MTVASCGSTGLASAERLAVAPPDYADSSTTFGESDSMTGTARMLAEILADVMHVEHVSVDSHFFEDLSADSLVMAHFCARVRKRWPALVSCVSLTTSSTSAAGTSEPYSARRVLACVTLPGRYA